MPTGYTADVKDGKVTEFPEFAMQCARAFGALIEMRDAPSDAPIPDHFEPSDYHVRALESAVQRLAAAEQIDRDEARRRAGLAYTEALAAYRQQQRRQAEEQARYEAMLDKVLAWEPPTPDHVEMKAFMVQQLEESIRFDCGYEWPKPTRQTAEQWLTDELEKARRDVAYHDEQQRKEVERVEGRAAWVRALRESLTGSAASGLPSDEG